jgi:inosose dehydratase
MWDKTKIRLGITPTGWTNDDFPLIGNDTSFEQVVSEIALAGFQGCSIGHNFPRSATKLKAALKVRGLQVSEPWVSTYFTIKGMAERTTEEFKKQLAFVKAVGGQDIGVAELGHAAHTQPIALHANKPEFDNDQRKRMVDGLNRLGELAGKDGMRLLYHPHMGTGVQTGAELDDLMRDTDPHHVHLLLDTGHVYWAGVDPVAVINKHHARIKHVHLKNIRQSVLDDPDLRRHGSFQDYVLAGIFTVPGDSGALDFKTILKALEDTGFQGWLVVEAEQDPTKRPPLEYALLARNYLKQVAGL